MKKNLLYRSLLTTALCATSGMMSSAQAPSPEMAAVAVAQQAAESKNRFSAGYRAGFNIGVKFKGFGGFAAQTNRGPATGGMEDRFYDDGYNRVDNNNNTYGDLTATRNWGYNNASQVVDARYIVMHSSSGLANISSSENDDVRSGFEMTYQREIQRFEKWRWGMESAFNYMSLSVKDSSPMSGNLTRINDAYEVPADEMGFRYIPTAPYANGNTEGPLLGSTPTRTTDFIAGGSSIAGSRDFKANLYGFRLGPYADIPLNERWRLTFSGGLALVQVSSDFKYTESVSVPGAGTATSSGSSSHSELMVGGYVAGNVSFAMGKNWEAFAGAQYQNVGEYEHKVNGRKAVLDLSKSVFFTVGVSKSF